MRIVVPRDQVAGVYASGVTVRHSGEVFLLDFIVQDDSTGADPGDALVVQRVRLHPSVVQATLAVLSGQLDDFEREYGPASQPGDGWPT